MVYRKTPAIRHPSDSLALRLGPARAHEIVILLHGVGASADQLLPLAQVLEERGRACLIIEGHEMFDRGEGRQWFSLRDVTAIRRAELTKAVLPLVVSRLLKLCECENLSAANLSLFGFSQGASLVLAMAATGFECANVVAIAGRAPLSVKRATKASPCIFISHAENDSSVPFDEALTAVAKLQAAGFEPSFLPVTQIGHAISEAQIIAVQRFLQRDASVSL